jgi:hypothetical protein
MLTKFRGLTVDTCGRFRHCDGKTGQLDLAVRWMVELRNIVVDQSLRIVRCLCGRVDSTNGQITLRDEPVEPMFARL